MHERPHKKRRDTHSSVTSSAVDTPQSEMRRSGDWGDDTQAVSYRWVFELCLRATIGKRTRNTTSPQKHVCGCRWRNAFRTVDCATFMESSQIGRAHV